MGENISCMVRGRGGPINTLHMYPNTIPFSIFYTAVLTDPLVELMGKKAQGMHHTRTSTTSTLDPKSVVLAESTPVNRRWLNTGLGFGIICSPTALPLQSAFSPKRCSPLVIHLIQLTQRSQMRAKRMHVYTSLALAAS